MTTAEVRPTNVIEHIGPEHHPLRNTLILGGAVLMIGLLILFYWYNQREGSAAVGELNQFRLAMYHRCGGQQFNGTTDPQLAKAYVDSSRMRGVVVHQFHQLQRAKVDCDEVIKALRSVDYPIR